MGRKTGAQRRAERERIRKLNNQKPLTNDMSLTEKDKQDAANEDALFKILSNSDKYRSVSDDRSEVLMQGGGENIKLKGTGLTGTNQQVSDRVQKAINQSGSKNAHRQSNIRDRGGLLRYPLEAMTDSTDYLQIDVKKYIPLKETSGSLISIPGSRSLSRRSGVPGGSTSTQSLVNEGTVLLQIPAQVEDGNSVSYGEDKLNSIVGAAAGGSVEFMKKAGEELADLDVQGAINAGGDAFKNALRSSGVTINKAKSLITKKLAASAVSIFGGNVSVNQLLAREEGQILNPNMELLFNGPSLRNFRFSFKMTPRSREEAEQCKLIIRTFKMNMAPKATSGPNLFINTPNVFELRYKSGFRNHPFLHKFKQCFLTDISVNYTAEGVYATYENREPISMIMNLTFKEIEPIYDIDYFDDNGFDSDNTVGF